MRRICGQLGGCGQLYCVEGGSSVDRVERALSFGAVAESYERFRPGYPDELFDLVAAYAGRPIGTALEIGAGTGKATRLFAGRGVAVTATEPDAAMLAELRKHVPASVTTVAAAFEQLPPGGFDLVYAAAALHWTKPEGRWERVSAMLAPGGVFASFGGSMRLADPALAKAFQEARDPFLTDEDIPSPDGTPEENPMQWPGTELEKSDLFTDVRQTEVRRRVRLSRQDWIGHLSTVSAYLQLPASAREQAFERIAQVLPGEVDLVADLKVHLARRVT